MPWRLLVVDGADKGRSFPLVDNETKLIGSSRRNVDIALNDLYVARVHCEVQTEAGKVFVSHQEGAHDTLVNNQKIEKQELIAGDVLRVGNSHLRLEAIDESMLAASQEPEAVEVVEEPEEVEVVEDEETAGPRIRIGKLAELSGQTLAYFKLGEVLGQGGCSIVFKAADAKNKQTVTLKVLAPEFPANEAEMQRFVKVMKTAGPLRHAHLVSLYNIGKTGQYTWIAREYVEGPSLSRIIEQIAEGEKQVDWVRALRVAVHIARALKYIHAHQCLHRNLTPKNILIQRADKVTKLADVMLVEALQGSKLHQATIANKFTDDLPYMAPEQTDPEAFVDALADLYSLGAVVYALLRGKAPFKAETSEEVIEKIRNKKPSRPSKYLEDIPEAFEAVVLKLLSKKQEDRYQTAAELLADLKPIVESEDVPV